MATYRYIFADLLTNSILLELPLYGVTFDRALNGVGNFQGFIGLDNTGLSNFDILLGTIPGKTALYIDRDGSLIWGGIIWSRTWAEQSKSLQFTGQTFESYFYKAIITLTLAYVNTDQRNILIALVNSMQGTGFRNIGIIVPANFSTGGILRTVTFNNFEVYTFGAAIEYLIGYDLGFDYYIDVAYDTNGDPAKYLRVDNKLGRTIDNSQLVFDYPGNIKTFWLPENAAKGCNSVMAIGAGEGKAMLRAAQVNSNSWTAAGYPELVNVYTNKDVSIQATLTSQASAYLAQTAVPVSVPTYELNPNLVPELGSYLLGDYVRLSLVSARFALEGGQKDFTSRIVGWSVTPTSSDSQEGVTISVQGQDDAA